MKRLLIICLALGSLFGCKKDNNDPDPSANGEKEYLSKLAGGWNISKATVDNKDVTSQFPSMILNIADNQMYAVVRGPEPMWPATGTFQMKPVSGSSNYVLVRDDGLEMEVKELTASKLVLEFTYVPPNARVTSVSGKYTFEFTRI